MPEIKTIDSFAKCVKKSISKEFPDCSVESITATKNNNVSLSGISIRPHDSEVSPTIYLDSYFAAFQSGQPFAQVLEQIMSDCRATLDSAAMDFNPDFLKNLSKIRDMIFFKLINKEMNRELLSTIPHRNFNGLAVVFYIRLAVTDEGMSTITITNNLLKIWGITERKLYNIARANTSRLNRGVIMPLTDILSGYMDMPEQARAEREHSSYEDFEFIKDVNGVLPMYVATNATKTYGAAVMLYKEFFEAVSKEIGSFLVLPSSIHELILVAADQFENDLSDIAKLVKEINTTVVSPEEILSDKCFYYSIENHTLKVIP